MPHAIQYVSQDIVYMSKPHYCPDCGDPLKKVKVSRVVNSGSDEAKDMPQMFSKTRVGARGVQFRSYRFVGDVKYVWKEFECERCHRHLTVEEMMQIEGVTDTAAPEKAAEKSPEELRRIKIKKLIFNKILPFVILALIAVICHYVK